MNKKIVAIIAVIVIVAGVGVTAITHQKTQSKTANTTNMPKTMTVTSMMQSNNTVYAVNKDKTVRAVLVNKGGKTTTYDTLPNNTLEVNLNISSKLVKMSDADKMSQSSLIKKYDKLQKDVFNIEKQHVLNIGDATDIANAKKAKIDHIVGKPTVETYSNGRTVVKTVSNKFSDDTSAIAVDTTSLFGVEKVVEPMKINGHYYGGFTNTNNEQLLTRVDKDTKISLN